MSQERVVPVKRFMAVDEAGREYHVVGSQRVVYDDGPAAGAGGTWGPGGTQPVPRVLSMALRTVEGFPVTRLSKGSYEVRIEGAAGGPRTVTIKSSDGDAP